ncbi:MAG: hypothetical protein ACKVQJ_07865 [Pyrinomonadaceae bacterium]
MSNKTIAKFSAFVIFPASICTLFFGCSFVGIDDRKTLPESHFFPPKVVGTIKSPDITESSGIAASRCQSGLLWTHNDSGDNAFIFAINLTGDNLGTWKIPNAANIDWEDIAAFKDKNGKCFLYIGEIGDNNAKRSEHAIYRISEPAVSPNNVGSNRQSPLMTQNAERLRFRYPDKNQDAETLMVHPASGDIYVVTKRFSGPAGVYRLKPLFDRDEVVTAEKVAEITVPAIPNGFVTGGDISPDGRHVIICDYTQAYEWTLPAGVSNFDDIWKEKPERVDLGLRAVGEAVCYNVDGTVIYATSEKNNSPLIEVRRK